MAKTASTAKYTATIVNPEKVGIHAEKSRAYPQSPPEGGQVSGMYQKFDNNPITKVAAERTSKTPEAFNVTRKLGLDKSLGCRRVKT